jgi:hypothetical protein
MEEKKLTWRERDRKAFKDMVYYHGKLEELGRLKFKKVN